MPDTPAVRVAALRLVLPAGTAAAGLTAAWLHGHWTPVPGHPVPFARTRPLGGSRLVRTGVTGRRQVLDGDLVEVGGLLTTSLLRTTFDLMRDVPLVEAVTVADAVTSSSLGLHTADLEEYVNTHRRWPGVARARLAVSLSSNRVRSPGESRLRMAVVLPGFPEPLVNPPIVIGTPRGDVLRFADLLMVVRRPAVLEYDGAYHDDEGQADGDAERENLLVSYSGLPVLRYRKKQLRSGLAQAVEEIARTCRVEPLHAIDPRDFALPGHRAPW